jgi:hypothetical protein
VLLQRRIHDGIESFALSSAGDAPHARSRWRVRPEEPDAPVVVHVRGLAVGLGKDLAHVTIAHPNPSTTIALVYGELDDVELLCEVERMVRDTLPPAIHFRIDHAVTTPWDDSSLGGAVS